MRATGAPRPAPAGRVPPGRDPAGLFHACRRVVIVAGMLSGGVIHHFLVTGFSAMVFFILMKTVIAPHLPAGAQKLILSA